jgi:alanyl-tRNA synthetase
MMTSSQIRQSFLDFFKSKGHTIVPSSSLMPDSPNLLFTNAGMNQFVPIFLGQKKADVSKWAGAIPGSDTRAADTQKCIRAGGKHNDLEDVGLDTYHHTFFEMLGNWSFGDYFKKEAIEWAWELVTEIWKFPKSRLYATIYKPGPGDPSDFDQEAWNHWAEKFRAAGLDPAVHIVNGDKKDNFWMMGDTGPCGPCSEIHVDLTPDGDTRGALVNKGDARCIEIWNLVFIQFNANPDGTFTPLPAKHVDTGMGFERVTSIIQGTKGFTDFKNAKISNYETDIFRPLFDALEKLSGKKYNSTLPGVGQASSLSQTSDKKDGDRQDACPTHEQIVIDVAFRVIADHIRTLGFAIADGIQPSNEGRGYVLRRILRRAVRYGRTLGFHEPFFYKLVDVLAQTMGDVFPEIRTKQQHVKDVLKIEEEAFNKTLDRGIALFEKAVNFTMKMNMEGAGAGGGSVIDFEKPGDHVDVFTLIREWDGKHLTIKKAISADLAFKLYDTYGFPLDLTELMARERGLTVDVTGFNRLMDEQKKRSQAAQKKEVIELSQIETSTPTKFVGFDTLSTKAKVLEVVGVKDKTAIVLDTSSAYAEMGGQVGDTGELSHGGQLWRVVNTQKSGNTWLHFIDVGQASRLSAENSSVSETGETPVLLLAGAEVELTVDLDRRRAIERHHTVTHLLHWALHEVVSKEASQKGSFVGPDKLTFDFSSAPLASLQLSDIEKLVNQRILENAPVSWTEVKYDHVKDRKDIIQFFGEKYGDWVRVVQIGGQPTALDGYSMELCGGTHTRATGEIGLFRIVGENAIAAGVRRIEAIAGLEAYNRAQQELQLIKTISGKINSPIGELEKKIESLLAQQKDLEKQVKIAMQRNASNAASELLGRAQSVNGIPFIAHNLGDADGDFLQAIADALKGRFKGVVVLGGCANNAVALVSTVSPEFTAKVQAGKIIQQIAPIVGGKGGGKPDNARGGGKDASKLDEALAKAKSLLG